MQCLRKNKATHKKNDNTRTYRDGYISVTMIDPIRKTYLTG